MELNTAIGMKNKTKLFDIAQLVEVVLINNVQSRDDDQLLCSIIWESTLRHRGVKIGIAPVSEFLSLYREGVIPMADSITRARRKLQELKPELRGNIYDDRQSNQLNILDELNQIQ